METGLTMCDLSGGATIISLADYRAGLSDKPKHEPSYVERVEALKGRILEATGLGFINQFTPLPEFVDLSEDDGA